ncbi:MAG: acyltransferase [Clostridia bacterium]|nr:acyltransferase [Clostridia bacterium]
MAWIDLARFLGIFAIVFGHTVQGGPWNTLAYSFHVPLFFFLQGVSFSLSAGVQRPFIPYCKKRSRQLLIPYAVWACLSTLLIMAAFLVLSDPQAELFSSPLRVLGGILFGNPDANRPLWFLPFSFLLSVFHRVFLKALSRYRMVGSLIGCLAGIVFTFFLAKKEGALLLPWNLEILLPMSVFFLLGYLAREGGVLQRLSSLSQTKRMLLLAAVIPLWVFFALKNGRVDAWASRFSNVLLYEAAALLGILAVVLFCMSLPPIPPLAAIGKSTVAILVMHKFPVLLFQKAIPFVSDLLARENALAGLAVTAVSILLCLAAERVFCFFCPILVGLEKKKIKSA